LSLLKSNISLFFIILLSSNAVKTSCLRVFDALYSDVYTLVTPELVLTAIPQRPQDADRRDARCSVASNTLCALWVHCAIAKNAIGSDCFEHKQRQPRCLEFAQRVRHRAVLTLW